MFTNNGPGNVPPNLTCCVHLKSPNYKILFFLLDGKDSPKNKRTLVTSSCGLFLTCRGKNMDRAW